MTKWLIIDGYNLIHRIGNAPAFRDVGVPRDLAGRRRCLIQLLEKTVGILAERITVVFDGRTGGNGRTGGDGHTGGGGRSSGDGPDEQESSVVEVLFSPGNKTADTVIEQLAFQAGLSGKPATAGRPATAGGIVVVTSDRLERDTTEAAGAETMACSVFLDQLNETLVRIEQELRVLGAARHPPVPLGNQFATLVIKKPGD